MCVRVCVFYVLCQKQAAFSWTFLCTILRTSVFEFLLGKHIVPFVFCSFKRAQIVRRFVQQKSHTKNRRWVEQIFFVLKKNRRVDLKKSSKETPTDIVNKIIINSKRVVDCLKNKSRSFFRVFYVRVFLYL